LNVGEKAVRLPGLPAQVAVARRFVAEALGDGHPCRADAMLLTSETGTNAIAHSSSGRPGGSFLLTVRWTDGWVRVAIADQGAAGAPCLRRAGPGEPSGRGIALLDGLAVTPRSGSTSGPARVSRWRVR
jgi:anti-sigma regulatory factor (Ser/Thr protein kinase)